MTTAEMQAEEQIVEAMARAWWNEYWFSMPNWDATPDDPDNNKAYAMRTFRKVILAMRADGYDIVRTGTPAIEQAVPVETAVTGEEVEEINDDGQWEAEQAAFGEYQAMQDHGREDGGAW